MFPCPSPMPCASSPVFFHRVLILCPVVMHTLLSCALLMCASSVQREAVLASAAAIRASGSTAAEGRGEAAAADTHWEVFFGRPTVSIPALFQAIAADAAQVRWGPCCLQGGLAPATMFSCTIHLHVAMIMHLCMV